MEDTGFIGLVTSFYFACWQQLGKIANPITGKIERNLEQAKYSIDMLIMLKDKTKGNLTNDEERALSEAVANLQMNYVDELNKPSPSAEEQNKPQGEEEKKEGTDDKADKKEK